MSVLSRDVRASIDRFAVFFAPLRLCAHFFGTLLVLGGSAAADDWPQWGGPRRDLVWREEGIVDRLPDGRLPRRWAAPIGSGYAGPAVADERVYVADRVADDDLERVLCFDADSGEQLWAHAYKCSYSISYPIGPRATPAADGDRVYHVGAQGHLFCLNVADGSVIWQKYFPEDFGTTIPTWGMAGGPLVDGDQVIVLVGGSNGALVVSFDKRTGEELWRALDDPAVGYCQPVILEYGGQRQLIVWHATAVSALDPADGDVLWQQPFDVRFAMTIATPRKLQDKLLVTAFYDGPAMIDLGSDSRSPEIRWRTGKSSTEITNDSLHAVMCTPIVTPAHVYGVGSYGELRCLDAATGEIVWETYEATGKGRWWNAFLVPHGEMSGERVFIHNEQGELIIATLSPEGYQEHSRALLIEPTQPIQRRMTIWSHPAFAMRSVFARNDKELVRVDLAK